MRRRASRQAIAKYEAALAGLGAPGPQPRGRRGRAADWRDLRTTWIVERFGASLPPVVVVHAQKSGDQLLESAIHSAVGFAQSLAGSSETDLDDALSHCETGLALARQWHGGHQEAEALNCLGEVAYYRGNLERALSFYERAESLRTRTRRSEGPGREPALPRLRLLGPQRPRSRSEPVTTPPCCSGTRSATNGAGPSPLSRTRVCASGAASIRKR